MKTGSVEGMHEKTIDDPMSSADHCKFDLSVTTLKVLAEALQCRARIAGWVLVYYVPVTVTATIHTDEECLILLYTACKV
jgi:hypothetical protein